MIDRIAISGYRSIRSIILRLGQLNVVTGANGSGKSNLYRSLRLIADAADGRLAESLAREGGFGSVRWAGPKKSDKDPVSLRLGFTADPLSYCFDLGLPQPSQSMFDGDPEMKRECLWRGVGMNAKDLCADSKKGTGINCASSARAVCACPFLLFFAFFCFFLLFFAFFCFFLLPFLLPEWGVLKTTAVQSFRFLEHEHKRLPDSLEPRPEAETRAGDILITRAGPQNRVGISCLVTSVRPRLMISDKIIRFHLIGSHLHNEFVALCLNAGSSQEYIEKSKSGMAASQMNIPQPKLRMTPIPIPPLAEQKRIVAKVDRLLARCDRVAEQLRDRQATTEQLLTATIHRILATSAPE